MASMADLRKPAPHPVRAKVDAVVGANFVERDGEQKIVDVVAAEVRVAVGGRGLQRCHPSI